MTAIRVHLDPSPGCEVCPLSSHNEQHDEWTCSAALVEDGRHRLLVDFGYIRAPSWCPLRAGPVTVEAAT